ncbi:MAG: 3-deoxy-8-phosphooctulonate synthase [Deltaproteobacteria bacterium]|nr:3-deoxy-8-phosphooctulonate synthase [Deltaproteobacteria bacterium]
MKEVSISNRFTVGRSGRLLLIAGPCQIESRDHALQIASFLKMLSEELQFDLIYKSSYDKANRTSAAGQRGIGMQEGLRILQDIKRDLDLPVLTDVHEVSQVNTAAEVVDVLQIPAFLCRQTDLLQAAGRSGRAVNIKKGQFLHPMDMKHAAEKVSGTGNHNILLCERGSCFGYRDLVVDMRGLIIMAGLGYPVVFDATHSVQQMGGSGGSSGGNREFVAPLARAAAAAGISGLFIECHQDPDKAPSDGASMLPLSQMKATLAAAIRIRESLER